MSEKKRTIGEFVNAVVEIDSEEEALRFYEAEVTRIQAEIDAETWESNGTAVEGARSNIGWCFGEGMASERVQMWHKVCQAAHPIFGYSVPTPREALEAGIREREKLRR